MRLLGKTLGILLSVVLVVGAISSCAIVTEARAGRGAAEPPAATIDWPTRPGIPPLPEVSGGEGVVRITDPLVREGERLRRMTWAPGVPKPKEPVAMSWAYPDGKRVTLTMSADQEQFSSDPGSGSAQGLYVHTTSALGSAAGEIARGIDADTSLLFVLEPPDGTARGILLVLASLTGSTPGEVDLIEERLEAGWIVAWTSPPMHGLTQHIAVFGPEGGSVQRGEVDFQMTRFVFGDPDREPRDVAADSVVEAIDEMLARRSRSLAAVLEAIDAVRPAAADLPVVVVGFSVGALAVPATVERLGRRVVAAVLVGGGADVFDLVRESSLFDEPVRISYGQDVADEAELDAIGALVRERIQLDPLVLAPRMTRIPVLQVHGAFDRIVPSESGDRLHEALGGPERWTYPVGHLGLFVLLRWKTDALAGWIDEQVAARAADRHPTPDGHDPR